VSKRGSFQKIIERPAVDGGGKRNGKKRVNDNGALIERQRIGVGILNLC